LGKELKFTQMIFLQIFENEFNQIFDYAKENQSSLSEIQHQESLSYLKFDDAYLTEILGNF